MRARPGEVRRGRARVRRSRVGMKRGRVRPEKRKHLQEDTRPGEVGRV